MNVDLSSQLMAVNAAKTQHSVQIAVMKKAHEMQQSVIEMVSQAALPPGQGARVDKRA
jgi:hypothetical protein